MKIEKELSEFVEQDIYNSWVKMLRILVPRGRTHRIGVVVASMVQYTYDSNPTFQEIILDAITIGHEETEITLTPYLQKLFQDAKVPHERQNRDGRKYSIINQSAYEFFNWHEMPWG